MKYFKVVYELLVFVMLAVTGASVATWLLHHWLGVFYV